MPRTVRPLSDAAIRAAKPRAKPFRLFDGTGLYLDVQPSGSKLWRLKYRFAGKEKRLALGAWPEVSLAEARRRRAEARQTLAMGIDPGAAGRRTAPTFETVAREWMARHLAAKAETHRVSVARRLERDVLPFLGDRPVDAITAPEVLEVVRRIEARGALETAHRALQNIGQLLRYAVATGRAQQDVTAFLRGALPPVPTRHMPAPADDPDRVGEILRAIEAFRGGHVVATALCLLPYLFVRPGELRMMRWADVDLDAAEWRFTASKTKTDHVVPLSRQACALLAGLRPITGSLPGGWVFPNGRTASRPLSDAALNAALRRMGIDTRSELTSHGWRSIARTMLHERLGFPPEVIEAQLAHRVPDPLGRAYNRTRFLDQRRAMMQAWADYLDELRAGGATWRARPVASPRLSEEPRD
jgi:integrase